MREGNKMKQLKILFVPSQTPDYLEDIIYHGLINICGRKNVVDYPFKPAYHYNKKRKKELKLPIQYRYLNYEKFPMLLFEDNKINYSANQQIDFDDFDIVIIGSLRLDVIKEVYKILNKVDNQKIIFLDGEDDPFIRAIYFKKLNIYFKREKINNFINNFQRKKYLINYSFRQIMKITRHFYDYIKYPIRLPIISFRIPKKIKPLPFGIIDVGFKPSKEKNYDFCFIGGFTNKFRKKVYRFLQNYAKRKNLKAFVATGGLAWKEYMNILSQSKIGIAVRGAGFDTYRYWEIPYAGAMLLSDLPIIEIPKNFEEGKSAAFFKNISELKEKLDYYLKMDRWEHIAKQGRQHLLKFHTSINRARTVLNEFLENLK
jgi:hypothetical protein